MHLQVKKMNGEILSLKESLTRVTSENISVNQQNQHREKVVNVYHHNGPSIESSDEEDVHTELKLTRRRARNSRSSHQYSRTLANTETKVGELLEGYRVLREEYKRLESTLGQLHNNHSDYRHLFQSLRS